MNRRHRDDLELGRRVALDLAEENCPYMGGNYRAQRVAARAEFARSKAERERIYATDYGLGDGWDD